MHKICDNSEWYDIFYVQHTKLLSLPLVAEALTGLIYHCPRAKDPVACLVLLKCAAKLTVHSSSVAN